MFSCWVQLLHASARVGGAPPCSSRCSEPLATSARQLSAATSTPGPSPRLALCDARPSSDGSGVGLRGASRRGDVRPLHHRVEVTLSADAPPRLPQATRCRLPVRSTLAGWGPGWREVEVPGRSSPAPAPRPVAYRAADSPAFAACSAARPQGLASLVLVGRGTGSREVQGAAEARWWGAWLAVSAGGRSGALDSTR